MRTMLVAALLLAACASQAPPSPTRTSALPTAASTPSLEPLPSLTLPPAPSPTAVDTSPPSATPEATATAAAGPASPDYLSMSQSFHNYSDGSATETMTVKWTPDTTPDTTVKVYGVNKCLNPVELADCVTHGMKIPSDTLLLLASAPADQGKASWQFWFPEGASYYCGALGVVADRGVEAPKDQWYYAILLRAQNADGKSKFVIAETTTNEDVTC